ncbi:MAG: FtsW/RodA/SpoVE family cell cycle protein, partial [Muribaculaceae bacterium]|nr:FtsW/RodA/SpoVE family cell cycle protein [Muribaculaceae bacterium]
FHMAIVTGVFPVSGQPLPMISKGGSSMLVTSLAFGVMLSVSRFAVQSGNKQDIKREKEALPESLQVENPTHIP